MTTVSDCRILRCSDPACQSQCGFLEFFTNLSNCTVTLQYQVQNDAPWHSLGTYGPGEKILLNGGALFLPKTSNIRVIKTDHPNSGQKSPTIITNWGNLGSGLPKLFVDNSMCNQESATESMPTGQSDLRFTLRDGTRVTLGIWISLGICLGLLVVCLAWLLLRLHQQR